MRHPWISCTGPPRPRAARDSRTLNKPQRVKRNMQNDKNFRPDRIGAYFRIEWLPLALVTVSGLIYNIGLLATPLTPLRIMLFLPTSMPLIVALLSCVTGVILMCVPFLT